MRNDTRETIQTYRNNMIRLVLILLKWHQKWKEARWFPTNDTVIICPKKPRRWPLCLSAIQTDSSDALCYRLWSCFFLLSCTQALLPPSQQAWALLPARTPEQQGGVATEASSQWAGQLVILQMPEQNSHLKCSSTLNQTLVLHSLQEG